MTGQTSGARQGFTLAAHLLFWGWNLWFLLWLGAGLGPWIAGPAVVAAAVGLIPPAFAACLAGLVLAPVAGMAVGLLPPIRRDPGRLLSVFYGVQAPVMVLLALRTFAIGVLSPTTALALGVGLVGAAGLLWVLLRGPRAATAVGQVALLVASAAYALVGVWVAAVTSLYGSAFALVVLRAVPDIAEALVYDLRTAPPVALGAGVLALSTLVALTYPAAILGISLRTLQLVHRASSARFGAAPAAGLAAGVVAALLLAFAVGSRQPQHAAFALLDAATTDAARREAVDRTAQIRHGLLTAALAPERTFDADPDGDLVRGPFDDAFGRWAGALPAAGHRALFAPFSYRPVREGHAWSGRRGSIPVDTAEAARLYASFFDAPIEVAEREALVAAARATWSWEDAQAGLLEVGQRKVHLASQQIEVEPHGDLATVRIHDVYRNRTWDAQEVLISFSLPASAALTGLWLGETDDRDAAFRFVVAPRGAAQEVYQEQLVVRRDPALLEQVGPGQYRLRAFPVPPRTGEVDDVWSITSEGAPMHLWLEAQVPVVYDAELGPVFPLPEPAEVRNLFWDEHSVRTLDGQPLTDEAWSPSAVPAPGAALRAHTVELAGYRIRATPAGPLQPHVPPGIAVLVDGTRSMEAHRAEVDEAIDRLRALSPGLTVWCAVEQRLARCPDFRAADALFWGAVPLESRLVEASAQLGDAPALVVLTDRGSYELAAAAEADGLPDVSLPPLWTVHFGGLPTAWPDWTLDRLQRSGGGVARSLDEALVRMADPEVVDGYRVTVEPVGPGVPAAPDEAFRAIGARHLVAWLDRDRRSGGLSALDTLHAVAVTNEIVTAYSSMIVLVDDAQRRALAEAEAADDRFDREVETGAEAMTGVPEPATWMLLGLAGVGAALGLRRRAA